MKIFFNFHSTSITTKTQYHHGKSKQEEARKKSRT